jgi:peptidase C39-like protein/tetratricopeptide repeat protein
MTSNGLRNLILPSTEKSEDNACMPLAINVVLKYWGVDAPINEVNKRLEKYCNVRGSVIMEGIEIAESIGFVVYIYKGNIKDLKKRLDQGIPVIVIMPGIQETIQHATIVTGYSTEEGRIFTYVPDPDTEGAFPQNIFMNFWKQDGSISIMIIPKELQARVNLQELEKKDSYRMCFEAERSILRKNHRNAIASLESAINEDKENSMAWSLLGSVYNELSSDQALKCFEKSIELNPDSYLSLRGIGNYHMKKAHYELAKKYYTQAIRIHEYRYGPIYKNLAIAKLNTDDNQGAMLDLREYLKQCPQAKDRNEIESTISRL